MQKAAVKICKHKYFPTNAHNLYKNRRIIKTTKNIKAAPTCFGEPKCVGAACIFLVVLIIL